MTNYRKPGQYPNAKRRSGYRKVRFAILLLLEDGGFRCAATDAEIARQAGFSVATVLDYIWEMENDGAIVTIYRNDRREIILTDCISGQCYIASKVHCGASIGVDCYEGDGPIATGRWPKCREVRDLRFLIPAQQ